MLGFQRGWRVAELTVRHRPRTQGRSKFGPERYARGLLDLFGVLFIGRYQYRPLHLFGGAGLFSLFVGFILCAYLTVDKLSGAAIGNRPLLVLGVLLIIAGIQLFTLGLVGEMITATRQDVVGVACHGPDHRADRGRTERRGACRLPARPDCLDCPSS